MDRLGRLTTRPSGKCLTFTDLETSALYSCHDPLAMDWRWEFKEIEGPSGLMHIQARERDLCITTVPDEGVGRILLQQCEACGEGCEWAFKRWIVNGNCIQNSIAYCNCVITNLI